MTSSLQLKLVLQYMWKNKNNLKWQLEYLRSTMADERVLSKRSFQSFKGSDPGILQRYRPPLESQPAAKGIRRSVNKATNKAVQPEENDEESELKTALETAHEVIESNNKQIAQLEADNFRMQMELQTFAQKEGHRQEQQRQEQQQQQLLHVVPALEREPSASSVFDVKERFKSAVKLSECHEEFQLAGSYTGVSFRRGRWRARVQGKRIKSLIGCVYEDFFDSQFEAAKAVMFATRFATAGSFD